MVENCAFELNNLVCKLLVEYAHHQAVFNLQVFAELFLQKLLNYFVLVLLGRLQTDHDSNLFALRVAFNNGCQFSLNVHQIVVFSDSEFEHLVWNFGLFFWFFLGFAFRVTFRLTVTLNGISVVIFALLIEPASVLIKEELEIVVIKFKSDHLIVFYYLRVFAESFAWLSLHFSFKRVNLFS
jgi:hypothetical protein